MLIRSILMFYGKIFLWILLITVCSASPKKVSPHAKATSQQFTSVQQNHPQTDNVWNPYIDGVKEDRKIETCLDEFSCLSSSLTDSDRLELEAIRTLHVQLDDDANGNIDLYESDEFLREELHYENGYEKRQKAFHRDDDMHISVKELWDMWIRSEVHNWTAEQTADWLVYFVQLPQYASAFLQNNIDGTKLPRLAVNNGQFFASVLGIKDPIHRQKIAVKAMDVVLFGPPRETTSHVKDVILIGLLIAALFGCWYTYRTNRNSKKYLAKLMQDMDVLSKAEKELQELQMKLQHARQEQDMTLSQKMQLERQLEEETRHLRGMDSNLAQNDVHTEEEIRQLRSEIEILRAELQRAEGELEDRLCWSPPPELQHWLQLTYELEHKAYNKKKQNAERQLELAKDACEKLRKKRTSLVAAFVSTHGRTIDDVDKSILDAKTSLLEVKQDLQERMTRWRQIESLCGFTITTNPGLNYLETLLRSGLNSRYVALNSSHRGLNFDDDDDDTNTVISSSTGNGSSQSISISDRPRTSSNVSRQRLVQRDSSKDSAVDVSSLSTPTGEEEPTEPAAENHPNVTLTRTVHSAVRLARSEAVMGTGTLHKSASVTSSAPLEKVLGTPIRNSVEVDHKSPLMATKLPARPSSICKSHEITESSSTNSFKPILRKISQSESALDVTFQVGQKSEESGQEETQSTDSSIPPFDEEGKKTKKKRFPFPNFVKRNKNKS